MAVVTVRIVGSSESAVKAFLETGLAADASAETIKKSGGKVSKAVEDSSSTSGFSLGNLAKSFMGMAPPMVQVGIAAGIAAAAVVTGTIIMAARFQSATDKLAASAGISTKAAAAIGTAFLATGGQTTFSAQQMVQAFTPVAGQLGLLNGHALTASQSLAFMRSAMSLAEATGQSLNSSTAALAQVMQAYGIPLKGAAGATDELFNTSRLLNIPVSTLSSTLDNLHTKLGPLAPSLGDVSTLLVDLATHGVVGSRGLMAVNTGMSTLIGGSKATKAEIADLGLKVFDANGKFVGMGSVIGQLAPKLAGMTQAQRAVAEKALFGATAGRELNATLLAGTAAYNLAAAAATKHGTATAAADKASSGLSGSMDKVKASLANAAVTIGQQFQPILQKLLGYVAVAANWFAQILPGALKVTGQVIGVVSGIIGGIVGVIATVIGTLNHVFGAGGVIDQVFGHAENFVRGVVNDIGGFFKTVFGAIVGIIQGVGNGIGQAVKSIVDVVIGVINFFIGVIDGAIGGINDALGVIPTFGASKIKIPLIPKIPVLDAGGIVTAPTLALLAANSRPEAVVPLSNVTNTGNGSSGGVAQMIFNISGNDPNAITNAIVTYVRRNGNGALRQALGIS